MTRLEELRRSLDGNVQSFDDVLTAEDVTALFDVAEAANEALENAIPAPRYGECIIEHGALGIALAPLVEATDD